MLIALFYVIGKNAIANSGYLSQTFLHTSFDLIFMKIPMSYASVSTQYSKIMQIRRRFKALAPLCAVSNDYFGVRAFWIVSLWSHVRSFMKKLLAEVTKTVHETNPHFTFVKTLISSAIDIVYTMGAYV